LKKMKAWEKGKLAQKKGVLWQWTSRRGLHTCGGRGLPNSKKRSSGQGRLSGKKPYFTQRDKGTRGEGKKNTLRRKKKNFKRKKKHMIEGERKTPCCYEEGEGVPGGLKKKKKKKAGGGGEVLLLGKRKKVEKGP